MRSEKYAVNYKNTDSTYPLSNLEIMSLGMGEQFKLYEENPGKWVYQRHIDI